MKNYFILAALFFICACGEQEPVEIPEGLIEIDRSFVVPDSLKKYPVVATFHDLHRRANGVIFLNEVGGKNATCITYLKDGAAVDHLWQTKSNEFESITTKAVYVIREKTIGIIKSVTPGMANDPGFDHVRTDVPE